MSHKIIVLKLKDIRKDPVKAAAKLDVETKGYQIRGIITQKNTAMWICEKPDEEASSAESIPDILRKILPPGAQVLGVTKGPEGFQITGTGPAPAGAQFLGIPSSETMELMHSLKAASNPMGFAPDKMFEDIFERATRDLSVDKMKKIAKELEKTIEDHKKTCGASDCGFPFKLFEKTIEGLSKKAKLSTQ